MLSRFKVNTLIALKIRVQSSEWSIEKRGPDYKEGNESHKKKTDLSLNVLWMKFISMYLSQPIHIAYSHSLFA